jgi:hypothetical protein
MTNFIGNDNYTDLKEKDVRKISIGSSQLLGIAGASLGYLDSRHASSRSALDGVKFAFAHDHGTWFWNHCGQIGFMLIAAAFLIQLFLTITADKEAVTSSR